MSAENPAPSEAIVTDVRWWKGAAIYQIYPRSFMDSNGDGIGDLPGIADRLGYVASLGVDAIWISPFFTSPMKDFGYDVADYCDVDPIFGTLADFDALVARAHELGLKVLIDQVYSHTSDEHPWFAASRSDRTNPRNDWYVWADAKPDGSPPSNWQSVFGGPAWTWDARRGQYYLHNFLASQPQMNLHNPAVQDAVLDVAKFWLERGVDGFRIDALNFAMHDPALRDNPAAAPTDKPRSRPFDFQRRVYNQSHPDIPKFIERIRALTDRYGAVFTVAEVGGEEAGAEMKAFTADETHLNSAYGFNFLYAERLTPQLVCAALSEWPDEPGTGWPSWAFENHDAPRAVSRWWGKGERHAALRLKMLLLAALRGNIILYQGEELGLEQVEIPFEQLHDPEAIANWPLTLSRDGARTPMPWVADAPDGGFGSCEPWLPMGAENAGRAVDVQEGDPGSPLAHTRAMLALRKEHPALRHGAVTGCRAHGDLLVLDREADGEAIRVIANFGAQSITLNEEEGTGMVLASINGASQDGLPPFGALVISAVRTAAIATAIFATFAAAPTLASETVASPDGNIVVTVDTTGEGIPFYEITRGGKPLISASQIAFNFTDEDPLRRGLAITGATRDSADTRWEQPWGERQWVRDHHNELAVTFAEAAGAHRQFTVRFRVFDNGVGFRSEFPARVDHPKTSIAEELTEFDIAPNGTAWWIQAGDWNRYEQLYQKTPIDAVSMAHTPLTVRLDDGTHLSFHEAALVDYSGMWLQRMTGQRFRTTLAPSSRGAKVVRTGAFTTPWRTIRIAPDAAGLVENDLELNLNEPNKLGDVSWFKPAKYIGIWWGMISGKWTWAQGPNHGATTERTRQYIDFAAKNGFRGVLVEGWDYGWDGNWFGNGRDFSFTKPVPDFDLPALAGYARSKGVHLIGHNETGGNIANYEAQLDDAMRQNAGYGIDVTKTGYVADAGGIIACNADIHDPCGAQVMEWHDGQRAVQHHLRVVEEAAKNHVAIDSHEPVKDTGLRRTYPNWVAREGARGQEYNAWAPFNNPPSHEPTLVYTRMLSGPMDYTPGILSLTGGNGVPMSSTLAKQLGLYLAIYSPIQMAADFIESLQAHPKELEFIKEVPADWSESHLIAGAVGEYAIFARKDRNSADWYAGGINDATARDVTLKFDFLDPGKTYTAKVWKDGRGATYATEARHRIAYDTLKVKKGDTMTLWLAPGGGAAIRLHPGK